MGPGRFLRDEVFWQLASEGVEVPAGHTRTSLVVDIGLNRRSFAERA